MNKQWIVLLSLLISLLASTVWAGPPPQGGQMKGPGMADSMRAIHNNLILPRLIAAHQDVLNLSAEQEAGIKGEIQKTQAAMAELEWDLTKRMGRLDELLSRHPVDEKQVMTEFNALLDLEGTIKRTRFEAMLRIKNTLTAEQLEFLKSIQSDRAKGRRSGRGSKPGGKWDN